MTLQLTENTFRPEIVDTEPLCLVCGSDSGVPCRRKDSHMSYCCPHTLFCSDTGALLRRHTHHCVCVTHGCMFLLELH